MKPNFRITQQFSASRMIRFTNFIIDNIFIFIINYCFGFLVALWYFSTDSVIAYKILASINDRVLQWIIGTFHVFLYYFLSEYFLKGRTFGKMITGTRVVDVNGLPPSSWEYLLRTICRIIPLEAVSFLFNDGWHDKWSETKVVNWNAFQSAMITASEIEDLGNKD